MRRRTAVWRWVGIAVVLATGSAGAAPTRSGPSPPLQRVLVTLAGGAAAGDPGNVSSRQLIRQRRRDADAGFARVRTRLAGWAATGELRSVTRLWVVNAVALDATPEVIAALRADPAVARVTPDATTVVPAGAAAEWNVGRIGADALWGRGTTGQGIVVAALDTGVDIDHPDLVTRWRGGTNSWFDPYGQHPTVPTDLSGHGTQVMGVMVGGDSGGSAVGVAPGARWIAARVFNDQGTSSVTAIHQAFQWVLDPDGNPATDDAPDVVNSSWGFASGACNLEFAPDIAALRAAGILPVFAAGNFGTLSTSPANNPGAFAVGSTTATDAVAVDSSRGPAACGEPAGTYPELTAPGVGVHTTDLGGLFTTASGTSLAAPHVAGALALLLSANPTLSVAQQTSLLEQHAVDLGDPGPDNTFGYGRLDVQAAFDALPSPPVDQTGPVVAPPLLSAGVVATGSVAVATTATDAGGTVAAAEGFTGTDPGPGLGTPLMPGDGAFDQSIETVSGSIDATALDAGTYTIHVRARDAAGNWGAPTTAELTIDRSGPAVTILGSGPNPTNLIAPAPYDSPAGNARRIELAARAQDDHVAVVRAEWFDRSDPGPGRGTALSPTGTGFAGLIDFVELGWPEGRHVIGVRAMDALGNWGASTQTSVTVIQPNQIFSDPLAEGNPSAWSAVTGAGRLRFVGGPHGFMAVRLNGGPSPGTSGSAYLTDNSPRAERGYHARFAFAPSSSRPGSRRGVILFAGYTDDDGGGRRVWEVRYRRRGQRPAIQLIVTTVDGAARTRWRTVSSKRATNIEVAWAGGALTTATLVLGSGTPQTLANLPTRSTTRIDSVRLGVQQIPGLGGNSGDVRISRFVSTRRTSIGP